MFTKCYFRPLLPGFFRAVVLCAAGAALTACSIADAVNVRKGNGPIFADDMVRFRTTYYFRTLDVCAEPGGPGGDNTFGGRLPGDQVFIRKAKIKEVLSDSLYRFRMTGKASPWSEVHFESGTLKSWQIDPFSSVAAYDKQNKRFYWKSQASTQSDAQEAEILQTVERLNALSKKLRIDSPAVAAGIDTMISQKLASLIPAGTSKMKLSTMLEYAKSIRKISEDALKKGQKANDEAPTPEAGPDNSVTKGEGNPAADPKENALGTIDGYISEMHGDVTDISGFVNAIKDEKKLNDAKAALTSARTAYSMMITLRQQLANGEDTVATNGTQSGKCSPGAEFRRGFQLIGPEGVKMFDQDDRLLLAMSSSAAPVIGALQELSGRMLKQKAGTSERLLPLVQQRLRLMEAQNLAKDMDKLPAAAMEGKLDTIIESLNVGDK